MAPHRAAAHCVSPQLQHRVNNKACYAQSRAAENAVTPERVVLRFHAWMFLHVQFHMHARAWR